ncbi:MAG: hypothetical protein EOM59_14940 [Clostridia bacterium]|nr:hypothetical protein [Clostridia bacterium]
MFINKGEVIFFEVKKADGKLSKIQEVTLNKLIMNGILAEVVYEVKDVERLLPPKGKILWS